MDDLKALFTSNWPQTPDPIPGRLLQANSVLATLKLAELLAKQDQAAEQLYHDMVLIPHVGTSSTVGGPTGPAEAQLIAQYNQLRATNALVMAIGDYRRLVLNWRRNAASGSGPMPVFPVMPKIIGDYVAVINITS